MPHVLYMKLHIGFLWSLVLVGWELVMVVERM